MLVFQSLHCVAVLHHRTFLVINTASLRTEHFVKVVVAFQHLVFGLVAHQVGIVHRFTVGIEHRDQVRLGHFPWVKARPVLKHRCNACLLFSHHALLLLDSVQPFLGRKIRATAVYCRAPVLHVCQRREA